MFEFLFSPANTPFTISILVVLGLAIIEVLSVLVGLSVMSAIDDLLPFDADVDVDSSAASGPTGMSSIVGFMRIDKVPFLVWLILYLTSFGIIGLTLTYLYFSYFSSPSPKTIFVAASAITALFATRSLGSMLASVIPKTNSSAISKSEFDGKIGQITIGEARANHPAEVVIADDSSQKHYVMAVPLDDNLSFKAGERVILVNEHNGIWNIIGLDN